MMICLLGVACVGADGARLESVDPARAELVDVETAKMEAEDVVVAARYRKVRTPGQAFSLLDLDTDSGDRAAYEIFLDSDFWAESERQIADGNFLVEFFSVTQPSAGDVSPDHCANVAQCRRVELYDYTNHATLTAYVDLSRGEVSDSFVQPRTVPDIPAHLIEVAESLASSSSVVDELRTEYGVGTDEAVMASTKTSLSRSRCERQEHLCVAPTYLNDDGAVWAIVDLTELVVAGAAWTRFDSDDADQLLEPVTLRRAEEVQIERYCNESHELAEGPWSATYQLTSSDGLHIQDLAFEGTVVAESIKLVDWHVSYSLNDGFGYSDAVGCPAFAQAAVVAADVPVVRSIDDSLGVGLSLDQDYWSEGWPAPCSYNYRQSLRMYSDGTFRPVATSQGKGCGDTGVYRPVLRVALPASLSMIDGGRVEREEWFQTSASRHTVQLGDNYELEVPIESVEHDEQEHPAWVYFTEGRPSAEGASELVTIGPCCNADQRQGPEQFVDDETLSGTDTVVWVVPELHNDPTPGSEACWVETVVGDDGLARNDVSSCSAGPIFRPLAR